ncbi:MULTISPECIES: phosphatase PAP2 family protein [Micromonospora]|uniref:Phosphatase PAP2 family protein n=1 Tax=Micromonospora chalcea TaxID=1874 RepID=A0ABX9Y9M6_MICCH|nr:MULTISPECIES: phosphatase PAP2 family protein [Micromonospora]EWM68848.1 PAP2 family protein [Micromonospora sp. M42]MBC8993299.1 phosphatase PAP2 family protein [Micromonospora chalcea]MBP1784341.1 membrane-associated phospholipid phosphatase [Micromonospora sp. HB375]MBQ1064317.1 phosphatase PAP2 family protein [Micromonospora sp. C41]MBQ1070822.1 phosphatase PAP2 family protein [Micromonospora sp. D75]
MRETARGWTAVWLVVLALLQTAAFVLVWRFAVHTELGQWLDTVALTGNQIGQDRIDGPVDTLLNAMSVVSLLAATAVIGFIALIRGRKALAVTATLLIAGANVTTQLLKHFLVRPDFGIDPERAAAGNSLPSGHTSVAASVAVALILVLPRKLRAAGAFLGAGYAAAAGVATLSAGWHRPSDAVAAYLVVGAWAAVAGLVLLVFQREQAVVEPGDAHRVTAAVLGGAGAVALLASALALSWLVDRSTIPVEALSRRQLFVGYAGSAAGIAGTIAVVAALVLVVVHRLVPRWKG